MIRIRQVKLNIEKDDKYSLIKAISKKIKINESEIKDISIVKKSLDARHKPDLYYVYEVDAIVNNEDKIISKNKSIDVIVAPNEEYVMPLKGNILLNKRPIIVGSGPAGLFCSYLLAKMGYKPIIIERGEKVEDRIKTVEKFFNDGILNKESNVQFGEGGAGTFSDGKLNTLTKDKFNRCKFVFEIFVECGANPEIIYDNMPHIGTDVLRVVVKNMREKIISMGGEFRYNSCLTDINLSDGKVNSIVINNNQVIDTDILVLAIGHSARDTFQMLYDNGIEMNAKPFAVGIRIEHPQKIINNSQYGENYNKNLKPASYKLTYKSSLGRGVYSFCMCPGGYVVNASSEEGMLAINGMSYYKRDSKNANSAIVVTVTPDDFGNHPLDGIKYQRELEKKAYELGNGFIPIQKLGDYYNDKVSTCIGSVEPIFKGKYNFANLNKLYPEYINKSLKEAIDNFGNKIKGFNDNDSIIAGVESRTSSPVRITRDEEYVSNILGIYPCGEGAGYAGGITTSAIDGVKVAEAIISKYNNEKN
ncbi:MAG: NAD(P)-binding protein [Bacilli bacterium]|nr:NAD(P)-binding protein [Bacilli bacterium]